MTLYKFPSTFVTWRRNRATNPRLQSTTDNWSRLGAWTSTGYAAVVGPDGEPVKAILADSAVSTAGDAVRYSMDLPAGNHKIGWWSRLSWNGPAPEATVSTSSFMSVPAPLSTPLAGVPGWHWYGFRLQLAAPATIYAGIRFFGGTTNADIASTKMLIISGGSVSPPATADEYFDGGMWSTPAVEYAWDGVADASESLMKLPDAGSTIETASTITPYRAARESRTVVHRLLDDAQALFTFRVPAYPSGVFEFLFTSHEAAYDAMNRLAAPTAWTLYANTDSGWIERRFMVGEGGIEMEQSGTVKNAYVLRVPYEEVDTL